MKKIIIFTVVFFFLFISGTALRAQNGSGVLIIYYSRDGHTKLAAEKLAQKFDAQIERLVDKKNRKGLFATTVAGKDALAKKLTEIEPLTFDPAKFDIILIGSPGWFSHMTPAVRTFLDQYDLSGKKIGLFGTAHLTGIRTALEGMAYLIVGDKQKAEEIPLLPLVHADLEKNVLGEKINEFYDRFYSVSP